VLPWWGVTTERVRALASEAAEVAACRPDRARKLLERALGMVPRLRRSEQPEAAQVEVELREALGTLLAGEGEWAAAEEQCGALLRLAGQGTGVGERAARAGLRVLERTIAASPPDEAGERARRMLVGLCGTARLGGAIDAVAGSLPAQAAGRVVDEAAREWLMQADRPAAAMAACARTLAGWAGRWAEDAEETAGRLALTALEAASALEDRPAELVEALRQALVALHREGLRAGELDRLAEHRRLAGRLPELHELALALSAPAQAQGSDAGGEAFECYTAYLRVPREQRWDGGDAQTLVMDAAERACRVAAPAASEIGRRPWNDPERLRWNEAMAKLLPGADWPRRNLARIALAEGDFETAVTGLSPAEAPGALSVAMFHLGRWDEALELAEEAGEDDPTVHAVRGICGTFARLPLELGARWQAGAEERAAVEAELSAAGAAGWPEVEACSLWLELLQRSAAPGPEDLPVVAELADAASDSRWSSIRALAGRALVFYDMLRQAAGRLEESAGAGADADMPTLEARLEAGRLGALDADGAPGAKPPTPAALAYQWRLLLRAEVLMQGERTPEAAGHTLRALVERWRGAPERDGYAASERRRLLGRGLAALARLGLAQNRPTAAAEHLAAEGIECLPQWELHYLQSLCAWQRGDLGTARQGLEAALRANPVQRWVRQELGVLIAEESAKQALRHLDSGRDRPALAGARAAALLALGREGEALEALEALEGPSPAACPRLSWPGGDAARVREGWRLRSELAERRRDWALMERCLDEVLAAAPDDLVARARRAWARRQRLCEGEPGDGERRRLEELVAGDVADLCGQTMIGEAMFYRSRLVANR